MAVNYVVPGKSNSGLVEYAEDMLGLPYWFGTFGQKASAELLKSKREVYPKYYTAKDFEKQLGLRVHDCSGLVKGYIWSKTHFSAPDYNPVQDLNAADMYAAAARKGAIGDFPKQKGLLLFKSPGGSKEITHVGVYDGTGYVIEAKGHNYGVVKTLYRKNEWKFWAQSHFLKDDTYVDYYPAYTGGSGSIVDALFACGETDTSKAHRGVIAAANEITNYTGSASQNLKMLNLLRDGRLIRP